MLDAHGPAASPDGVVKLKLAHLTLFQQTFNAGRAELTLHGREPRLQIDELVLEHGQAKVVIEGRFGPDWI